MNKVIVIYFQIVIIFLVKLDIYGNIVFHQFIQFFNIKPTNMLEMNEKFPFFSDVR